MRRTLSALILAVVFSLLVVLNGTSAPVQPGLRPVSLSSPRIMVVGDSISQGLEGDFTWRYRLKNHLNAKGVTSDFVGPWTGTTRLPAAYPAGWPDVPVPASHDGAYRSGISFADNQNLAQWGWQMAQAKWEIASNVRTYSPDYLLVELGFNDLGWGVSGPSGTLESLRELVTNARAAKPDVRILIANVSQRSPLSNNPDLPQKITDYNSLLPGFVSSVSTAQSPVALVDVDSPFDYASDSYDGLHPNVRGEYVIARAFANVMANRFGVGTSFGAIPSTLPADLAPAAPQSINVSRSGTALKIAWSHSFGAGGYRLYKRDVTLGETFKAYPYDVGADSWTETIAPAGHEMAFKVKAVRGNYISAVSPTASATVKPLPAVPNLTGKADADRPYTATISWDPVPESDDYHVYAASTPNSCDEWPPSRDSFKLVQWSLGSKTSWTQEYVLDMCVWYYVVASRYGGEGEWTMPVRVWPYQNNANHYYARNRYFDTPADDGDQKLVTRVAAGPDRGIVVARGFIRNSSEFNDTIGDHRQFDTNPYASSKIGVAWDTGSGEIGIYTHRSCAVGQQIWYAEHNLMCKDSYPIRIVPNATVIADSNQDPYNYVSVSKSGDDLILEVAAINSWENLNPLDFGRIHAQIRLTASGGSYNVSMTSDRFPAWEFIRYPRTGLAPAGSMGTYSVLGTRDQTSVGDLSGTSQVTCTSTGEEYMSWPTRPMSCN